MSIFSSTSSTSKIYSTARDPYTAIQPAGFLLRGSEASRNEAVEVAHVAGNAYTAVRNTFTDTAGFNPRKSLHVSPKDPKELEIFDKRAFH